MPSSGPLLPRLSRTLARARLGRALPTWARPSVRARPLEWARERCSLGNQILTTDRAVPPDISRFTSCGFRKGPLPLASKGAECQVAVFIQTETLEFLPGTFAISLSGWEGLPHTWWVPHGSREASQQWSRVGSREELGGMPATAWEAEQGREAHQRTAKHCGCLGRGFGSLVIHPAPPTERPLSQERGRR